MKSTRFVNFNSHVLKSSFRYHVKTLTTKLEISHYFLPNHYYRNIANQNKTTRTFRQSLIRIFSQLLFSKQFQLQLFHQVQSAQSSMFNQTGKQLQTLLQHSVQLKVQKFESKVVSSPGIQKSTPKYLVYVSRLFWKRFPFFCVCN